MARLRFNIDAIYPIGSIYFTTNSINPSVYFGGDWERISNGKCLVGVDESQEEFNTVLKSGGNKFYDKIHLTNYLLNGSEYGYANIGNYSNRTIVADGSIGGAIAHPETPINISVLQPYLTVYIWQRIA